MAAATRLLRRSRIDDRLGSLKLRAIDAAAERIEPRTMADLGGIWAVDGGYSLYAVDNHGLERATICDFEFTDAIEARAGRDRRIKLVQGNFTSPQTVDQVGAVDVLLMFDVLLHQVQPDWPEVLRLYADHAQCMVLAGPWWNGPETVRLLELGREEYLNSVPLRDFHEPIIDKLDEFVPERDRAWRDCQDIWQWGITDQDLRDRMGEFGFRLAFHENAGRWRGLERFDDCSYVFVKDSATSSEL